MLHDVKTANFIWTQTVMLKSLQALRAVAASLVVATHTVSTVTAKYSGDANFVLGYIEAIGGIGVDIFFVISGFIMMYTTLHLSGGLAITFEFWLKRICRIAPIYWILTTVLILALSTGLSSESVEIEVQRVLANFLFWPSANQEGLQRPILTVGWTLVFEMYFYFLFGFILLSDKKHRLVLLTGMIAPLALFGLLFPDVAARSIVLETYTSPIILEFLFGGMIGWFYIKYGENTPRILAYGALLIGLILLSTALRRNGVDRWYEVGIPAALVIFGVSILELRGVKWVRMASLKPLGDASYSIYLTHPLTLLLFSFVATRVEHVRSLPVGWVVAIAFITSLSVGVAFFYAIERWFERRTKHLIVPSFKKFIRAN